MPKTGKRVGEKLNTMKKNEFTKKFPYLLSFAIATIFCACTILEPTVASYDQYAYAQTTSLKIDALNLMDSAIYSYQSELKNIVAVETNVQKLYEYDKNRPKNAITTKQWKILTDSTGPLGGFFAYWKNKKVLKTGYINDAKSLVDSSFSQIARLEAQKTKPTN